MFRKQLAWFGPFREFVYFDLDIVVLQPLDFLFDLLGEWDIVFHGDGRCIGVKEVFTESVYERGVFSQAQLLDVFNAGFFASRRGAIARDDLMRLLARAAEDKDLFLPYDQDQGVLNYVVLSALSKRCDLSQMPQHPQMCWAGSDWLRSRRGEVYRDDRLPIAFVHWAGFRTPARRPHGALWLKYRYPGVFGPISRAGRRLCWLTGQALRRLLTTNVEGWYKPAYQCKRLKRIILSLIGRLHKG